jgi:hypothetical protein
MAKKSPVMQLVDQMLAAHISPILRAEGFTKMHRTYVRHTGSRWDIVELQVFSFGTADDTRFTLNVGRHDERRENVYARRWKKHPQASACTDGSHRIGEFGRGKDTWWTVNAEANMGAIGNEVGSILRTAVLPYLAGTRSVTGR